MRLVELRLTQISRHVAVILRRRKGDYPALLRDNPMSRYLTPPKICFLVLITLYTDTMVPTSASIPVLSFIVTHLLSAQSFMSHTTRIPAITIDRFQKATMTHASGIPGRTLWDLFLKKLWGINSFDALHVFFDALSSLLVKTKEDLQKDAENNVVSGSDRMLFSRTSPFGAFIRRAQLEFTRLQFHDGITLWKSLIVYREPTLSMWRRRNPTAGDTTFDVNLMQDNLGYDHRLTQIMYCELQSESRSDASFSTDDLEKLLEFLVSRMQSTGQFFH